MLTPVNANFKRLFRTSRAMGAFSQNFLSEDWLSERVKENQSTLIAQLSTGSAEEPQNVGIYNQSAHLLTNDEKLTAMQVCQNYETLLTEMEQAPTASEALTTMLTTFRKVTASYWPGLFHCYDHADLPCTNNDLEQYFGSARHYERRATGRKTASPGVVVRGAMRIVASVATRLYRLSATDLQPTDVERWYVLRNELDTRQQSRRAQFRFRRDPDAYLATLENKLLQLRLPP